MTGKVILPPPRVLLLLESWTIRHGEIAEALVVRAKKNPLSGTITAKTWEAYLRVPILRTIATACYPTNYMTDSILPQLQIWDLSPLKQ